MIRGAAIEALTERHVIDILRNAVVAIIGGVLVALAVANRHVVPISLNPFDPDGAALRFGLPLFAVILGALLSGIALAGLLASRKVAAERRARQAAEAEVARLGGELAAARTPLVAALTARPPAPGNPGWAPRQRPLWPTLGDLGGIPVAAGHLTGPHDAFRRSDAAGAPADAAPQLIRAAT